MTDVGADLNGEVDGRSLFVHAVCGLPDPRTSRMVEFFVAQPDVDLGLDENGVDYDNVASIAEDNGLLREGAIIRAEVRRGRGVLRKRRWPPEGLLVWAAAWIRERGTRLWYGIESAAVYHDCELRCGCLRS